MGSTHSLSRGPEQESVHHIILQQAGMHCTHGLWEVLYLCVSYGASGTASSWNIEQLGLLGRLEGEFGRCYVKE